ncbi:zinc-binding metallopeptidase family protein [Shewanella sp. HL-SH8]|uniref:zinc-binding metallopeptidase family protein n=1 Tax=Shewanella sp. HL-SH8 TaxID=3436242 RepID=UPI003EC0FC51
MKTFSCQCGSTLHFANSKCVSCSLLLGFIPDDQQLSAFTKNRNGQLQSSSNGLLYRQCKNYSQYDVCNWMVPIQDSHELCVSCRLTEVIPNLSDPNNIKLWFRMEQGKRRLLYTLLKLNLPIINRTTDPISGLGFAFLQNQVEDEYGNELTVKNYVSTGHSAGLITINLDEADSASRIQMREMMEERYRTLVGHFRHESGHYFWDRLIKNSPHQDGFRALFGDERLDYANAMSQYYQDGPANNWQNVWISAYASMHPWEDWAETWAHYLHMVDTLETANDFQFSVSGNMVANPLVNTDDYSQTYTASSFTHLFNDWCRLTAVLNALNRSMGMDDAYPFVISITALDKLRFIHEIITDDNSEIGA